MTQDADKTPFWLLRRGDQVVVAVVLVLGMAAMIGWWTARGGCRGRLVEADQAQEREFSFKVDINRAAWPELAVLPGIGESMARKIVASREKEGPFADHDDLQRVRGIGAKTVERIRPFLLPVKSGELTRRAGRDPST